VAPVSDDTRSEVFQILRNQYLRPLQSYFYKCKLPDYVEIAESLVGDSAMSFDSPKVASLHTDEFRVSLFQQARCVVNEARRDKYLRLRRSAAEPSVPFADGCEHEEPIGNANPFIDDLKTELARLSIRDRDIIALRYQEGLDFSQIAKELNMSPGAVRVRHYRAKSQLRVWLILRSLCRARQRTGLVAMPFGAYVTDLARLLDISIDPVLSWLKISDLSTLSLKSAPGFARLGWEIGLSLRETMFHVRLTLADSVDYRIFETVPMRANGRTSDPLDLYESRLLDWELDCGHAIRQMRVKLLNKIQQSYESCAKGKSGS
jgi:RNA polymerase sigma factor (sigma-70 family)